MVHSPQNDPRHDLPRLRAKPNTHGVIDKLGPHRAFTHWYPMRLCLIVLPLLLGACEDRAAEPSPSATPHFVRDPITGETRARIATGEVEAARLRSGASVPVALPTGFTVYPGARVVRTTVVERGVASRTLVEFETPDPIAKVLLFHRRQAQAAGAVLTLDLEGTDAASIGGQTASGGSFALTARRDAAGTSVQLSVDGEL